MARQQPESKLVNKIKANLENKIGGLWIKVHGGPYQQGGISDLLGCVDGCYIALEVKIPERRNEVTKKQAHFIKQVIDEGGIAAVVTSVEEALEAVEVY